MPARRAGVVCDLVREGLGAGGRLGVGIVHGRPELASAVGSFESIAGRRDVEEI